MKKGFTLAEVLITLSIIAVVAILTIPALVKEYKYKLYGASLQKAYSQINDAIQTAMNDDMTKSYYMSNASLEPDGNCKQGGCYFIKNYLNILREDCQKSSPSCLAESYSLQNSNKTVPVGDKDYCGQMQDGVTVCITKNYDSNSDFVFIDTNGSKEPNIVGIDAFTIFIHDGGYLNDRAVSCCNKKNGDADDVSDYSMGCLRRIMDNGWKVTDIKEDES